MFKGLCILAVCTIALAAGKASAETRIKCASTTSTQNSGLFDYLLPIFAKKTGIQVVVVAVGTGASIEIGKRGPPCAADENRSHNPGIPGEPLRLSGADPCGGA